MKADYTPFEEFTVPHPVLAVIVGIADYVTRKDEKEIYGEITVVDYGACRISRHENIKMMIEQHEHRCYAAQSVEYVIAWFRYYCEIFSYWWKNSIILT